MAGTSVASVNGGLTFDSITSAMATSLASTEATVSSLIQSGGSSTTDLLAMQAAIQQWTLASNIQSTVVKDLGDALKAIVQKAS